MARSEFHVVLVPFSAFGHLIPFFQLSIALAKAGVHVSYISTPRNIERLPKVPPRLSSFIDFVPFPLPEHPLLPRGAEATMDLPFDMLPHLVASYDKLQGPVKEFVAITSPDWLVVDFFPHWAVEISEEFHVPLLLFSVFCAAFMTFLGPPECLDGPGRERARGCPETLVSKPEWVDFPSSVAYRGFEAVAMHPLLYRSDESEMRFCASKAKILRSCHAVAFRSCYEFEGEYLKLYEKLSGKTVIPAGLLPPKKYENTAGDHGASWSDCFKWLDQQQPKSVVFVGFGTETRPSTKDIAEIALGLQLSELPFLWALRNPSDEQALPSGFVGTRGKVCLGWSPQMEILAHPSIRGSLFHSGWGSIIETLQFGHAMVVLPFVFDQGPNARLLTDKGLAVEVERGADGSFTRDDIAKSLRLAMLSGQGDELRDRCREAATYFGDHELHQDHYIANLVHFLRTNGPKEFAAE